MLPSRLFLRVFVGCFFAILSSSWESTYSQAADPNQWEAGVAKRDITPTESIRLSGYAARGTSTDQVDDPLSVRAMVLKPREGKSLLVVSIDSIGIAPWMTEEIVQFASESFALSRAQIVLCTTHSHSAPYLEGSIGNLFGAELTKEETESIHRYSHRLVDETKNAIREAHERMQEARVTIGEGKAGFAMNRRPPLVRQAEGKEDTVRGPVDQRVRILQVQSLTGAPIAVAFQYACHCTSIDPEPNKVSADWAGIAATHLEQELKGAVALPIIGTGADANPQPRGKYEDAFAHGQELATAILDVLPKVTSQLPYPSVVSFSYTALDFERPSVEFLQGKLNSPMYQERFWAQSMLDILKVKDRLPESYPAPAHFWAFGNELAWVFLGGEVVVDFQIRLESELSQFREVWVASYVDDVFAYVASERVRAEGGYEVDSSMLYYNRPGRWISGTEGKWIRGILDLQRQTRAIDEPLNAADALKQLQMPAGWKIEQVAAEPLVEDPVNISFGADGKVWIAEMGDYPYGDRSKGKVKFLQDVDGDGVLDKATLFLDELEFPAGVYAWRDGVLVASAPEVFFARDTDGDGVADERTTILSGFPFANPQHRVHGFTYGLDHKLYFGAGSDAHEITLHKLDGSTEVHNIQGADLCLDPDRRVLTLESGETQFIRSQDQWGNWFGNDNSHPLYHFVFDRNWKREEVNLPRSLYQYCTNPPSTPQVFPLSQPLDRFNEPYSANRFTSACSSIINWSLGTGDSMQGAAIVCEPVHNLVSRFEMSPQGMSFNAHRFPEDQQSEWIRSEDPWFRPVRVANAPDGTVWVVDMYRRVIEHPTWIPEDWLARVDVYAGSQQGRLYRAHLDSYTPTTPPSVLNVGIADLVQLLSHEIASVAEQAQQQLIWNYATDSKLPEALRGGLIEGANAQGRLRCFSILNYLGFLKPNDWAQILKDSDPRVVSFALQTATRSNQAKRQFVESLPVCFENSELIENANFARLLFVVSVNQPEIAISNAGKLLRMHRGVPGFENLLQFVDNDRIDALAEEVFHNLDSDSDALVGRLIPRVSTDLQSKLVATIRAFRGDRPAWHFYLSSQLAKSNESTNPIDETLGAELWEQATEVLQNDNAEIATRYAALDYLMSHPWTSSEERVGRIIEVARSTSSFEIAQAILRGLVTKGVETWDRVASNASRPDPFQDLFVNVFLAQPRSADWLLAKVQNGEFKLPAVRPSVVENLRSQSDPGLLSRVEAVFGKDERANRGEVIREYIENWPKDSDREAGKALFAMHCAACHSEREHQGERIAAVGPVLTALNHWTNDAWITAVLDPSKSVDTKYTRVIVLTDEDEVFSGMKVGDSDERIELVTTDGRIVSIEKSSIAETKVSSLSLMPDGFEKTLSVQQVADIVKFLRSSE